MSVPAEKSSNQAKFETSNPVVQRLIAGFFAKLESLVAPLGATATLDAGCGEGETIARLGSLLGPRIEAVDIEQGCVDTVAARLPGVEVRRADLADLPFGSGAFDLVLCLEVLEHIGDPSRAVRELARVGRRDVVVSVPYEPWFRLGSLLRGKYVRTLGNHPEHVNHFRRRSLRDLLEPELEVADIRVAFPWLIAAARVPG